MDLKDNLSKTKLEKALASPKKTRGSEPASPLRKR